MRFFEQHDITFELYQRYVSLTINKDFAHQLSGSVFIAGEQDSEQSFRRRELLAVEEQAKQNQIIKEHGEQHFRNQVKTKFFTRVGSEFNSEIEDKAHFFQQFLKIEGAVADILEILSLRAASINRISPLVRSLDWLSNDVVNLVNKPQYRKNSDVTVSDSNLAISYIGLENLKLVMPTFILKHWLPTSTAPHPLMKRKLWNDSLSVALGSRVLAESHGIDWYHAFAAGMMSNLGVLATTRCFMAKFNEIYNQEVKEAYDNRDKRLHDALVSLEGSPELLLEHILNRGYTVGADLVEQMRFDRLPITEPLFDLGFGTNCKQMSDIAKIVVKAKAYVMFRSLAKDDLIDNDEAKLLLSSANLTAADVSLLKKSDIDHIKLNFK
ncbi:HDOD domain-containing protein [Thalassotalea euphylliae]|uniref:HDOD domain-containing protein n=1 Tax=Thalassotalea euphylliae TaxID=1655234 RepID=UPI003644BA3B